MVSYQQFFQQKLNHVISSVWIRVRLIFEDPDSVFLYTLDQDLVILETLDPDLIILDTLNPGLVFLLETLDPDLVFLETLDPEKNLICNCSQSNLMH